MLMPRSHAANTRRYTLLTMLLALSVVFCACHNDKDAETAASEARKLSVTSLNTKGLEKHEYDLNNDGKMDQVRYIRPASEATAEELVYATYDINFDGINDITEFYEKGEHVRDEVDLDYDGVIDVVIQYANGHITKKEFSYDFERNRYGIQFFNENGERIEIHHDTNGDGKTDSIEYFHPGELEPYKTETVSNATTTAPKTDDSSKPDDSSSQNDPKAPSTNNDEPNAGEADPT